MSKYLMYLFSGPKKIKRGREGEERLATGPLRGVGSMLFEF